MTIGGGDSTATLTVIAISATVAALPQFLPNLAAVHRDHPGTDGAADIRVGEVAAAGFFIAVGVVAAGISGSSDPIMAGALMGLFVVIVYEAVLRGSYFGMGELCE